MHCAMIMNNDFYLATCNRVTKTFSMDKNLER